MTNLPVPAKPAKNQHILRLSRSWTWLAPACGWLLLAVYFAYHPIFPFSIALAAAIIACVLAGVHHAEVVAHRVGEPLGTIVLALVMTMIEVALIVSLMLSGDPSTTALARDTVFASIMIILNGMIGLCLLMGSAFHHEQTFGLYGVNATLATLATMAVFALILPNMTTTIPGPFYAAGQLKLVAILCLALYGVFILTQTVRHRDYFLPPPQEARNPERHAPPPSNKSTSISAILLVISLVCVILLAHALSPVIEAVIDSLHAPKAVLGIVIALIVLLPESLAALKAARANRLQTSLNLALGSAMASIGLTIPAVAIFSIFAGWTLVLGLDAKEMTFLGLSLLVATLSLGTGRTTILQGAIHLVIFAVYIYTAIVP